MDDDLTAEIRKCRQCADRFAATATQHYPRPVPWFRRGTPIMVAGQAPGMRVHKEGKPFWDRSGDRLREWMGISRDQFYDRDLVSVLPTAFCFPGYDAKGADLPPPPICWDTWHDRALAEIGKPKIALIVGTYAIRQHLGLKGSLTDIVADWRDYAPEVFVLPHPSWRNNAWLKKNAWFAGDLVPALQQRIATITG
ncbi:uracil-DNA glycosylase family protein [Yoonia sp. 2307UL14-13]|uniref:uracil-DNA glycosylase family protein n=1 Tax=Yoonia sp. 2307UL14-13 TaxID=3126506 RepID=UPI00309A4A9D